MPLGSSSAAPVINPGPNFSNSATRRTRRMSGAVKIPASVNSRSTFTVPGCLPFRNSIRLEMLQRQQARWAGKVQATYLAGVRFGLSDQFRKSLVCCSRSSSSKIDAEQVLRDFPNVQEKEPVQFAPTAAPALAGLSATNAPPTSRRVSSNFRPPASTCSQNGLIRKPALPSTTASPCARRAAARQAPGEGL